MLLTHRVWSSELMATAQVNDQQGERDDIGQMAAAGGSLLLPRDADVIAQVSLRVVADPATLVRSCAPTPSRQGRQTG